MEYCSEANPDGNYLTFGDEERLKQSFLRYIADTAHEFAEDATHRTYLLLECWYSVINDYTRRSLSFISDTFPAIAGLAKEVHNQTGFTYQAGLWEQDAHRGLLWMATQGASRHESYQAPSWSWAAPDMRLSAPPYIDTYLFGLDHAADWRLKKEYQALQFNLQGVSHQFNRVPTEGSYLQIRSSWTPASAWWGCVYSSSVIKTATAFPSSSQTACTPGLMKLLVRPMTAKGPDSLRF